MTYQDRIKIFIKNIISWQRLLCITGGEIAPDKSLVYIISYIFDQTGASTLCTIEQTPGEIKYTGDNGTEQTIERLETSTAERNLGIRLVPSCQWFTEFEYRLGDIQTFCGQLSRAPFSHIDSKLVYSCRYSPISQFFDL